MSLLPFTWHRADWFCWCLALHVIEKLANNLQSVIDYKVSNATFINWLKFWSRLWWQKHHLELVSSGMELWVKRRICIFSFLFHCWDFYAMYKRHHSSFMTFCSSVVCREICDIFKTSYFFRFVKWLMALVCMRLMSSLLFPPPLHRSS